VTVRNGAPVIHSHQWPGNLDAVPALLLGSGLKISADQQAGGAGLAAALTGRFVRTQATDLTGPDGAKRTTA
jgi:hypothetical protein